MALSVTGITMQKLLKSHVGFILMIYFQRKEIIMIKLVTMYSLVCDRCGKTFCKGNTTITGADKKSARGYALESGWQEIGDKHYCPNCCKFTDILSPYV